MKNQPTNGSNSVQINEPIANQGVKSKPIKQPPINERTQAGNQIQLTTNQTKSVSHSASKHANKQTHNENNWYQRKATQWTMTMTVKTQTLAA